MFTINISSLEKTRYETFQVGIQEKVARKASTPDEKVLISKQSNKLIIEEDVDLNSEDVVGFFKENFVDFESVIRVLEYRIHPKPYNAIF